MNFWPAFARSMYAGLRVGTLSSVRAIDEGGLTHLQGRGSLLIAANHSSHADTPVLFATVPPFCRRRLRVVASSKRFGLEHADQKPATYFARWILHGLAVHAYRGILVGGDESGLNAVHAIAEAINLGAVVAIYPEGTRSTNGTLGSLQAGVAMLAIATGCQVVPARIDGTLHALPKARWIPRLRNRVTVRFRAPIAADPNETHQQFLRRLTTSLSEHLEATDGTKAS